MADDDDWVGEPPEGRYTRDRAKPEFWRNQWQAIVATSLLGIFVILAVGVPLRVLARDAAPAGAHGPHARGRAAARVGPCGPRRGRARQARDRVRPLLGAAVVADASSEGSGSCLTAHQTSQIAAMIGSLEHDEEVEHRPAHLRASYPGGKGARPVVIRSAAAAASRGPVRPINQREDLRVRTHHPRGARSGRRHPGDGRGGRRRRAPTSSSAAAWPARASLAGGVLFSGFVSPAEAAISTNRRSKKNDVRIANYALTLEYLSRLAGYKQVQRGRAVVVKTRKESPRRRSTDAADASRATAGGVRQRRPARIAVGQHEAAHVKALKAPSASRRSRSRSSTSATPSRRGEVQRDRAGAGGHGRGGVRRPGPEPPRSAAIVKAALSIHSVEARHAAWIRYINSRRRPARGSPCSTDARRAEGAFDKALSEKTVLKAVTGTGFIK